MSHDASPALPAKVLVALTSLVVLAHLVVLGTSFATLGSKTAGNEMTRAFTTRTVELAPPRASPTGPALEPKVSTPAATTSEARPASARPRPLPATPTSAPVAQTATPVEAIELDADASQPPPAVEAKAASSVETGTAQPLPSAPTPAPRPPREVPQAFAAHALPASVRLNYAVQSNKFPFSLNSEMRWQHDGQRYEARLSFGAFGQSRVQTSRGTITPEGLAPLRFSDKFKSEVAAHFDREKSKVSFSANTPDAPLLAGAQDRLSILVQLCAMVASHPEAYPEATTIAIQTIGPRDADTWLFTVERPETLVLPGGEHTALKLVRNPRKEFDQRVEVWLAPAQGYLPVRIRITDAGGTYVDQQWQSSQPQ